MRSASHKSQIFPTARNILLTAPTLFLIVLAGTLLCYPQQIEPDRGVKLGNSYQVGEFDTVNTTNGNLMINLQLGSLPAGRGSATAGVYLTYNSKLYNMRSERRPDYRRVDAHYNRTVIEPDLQKGGWRLDYGYRLEFENRFENYEPPCTSAPSETNDQIAYSKKLRVIFPDGSSHEMIPLGHKDKLGDRYFNISMNGMVRSCNAVPTYTTPPTYYSLDGTFLRLEPTGDTNWILYFPDGSKVVNGTRIYDRNGNYVDGGYGATDQFGRSINISWASNNEQLVTSKGFDGEDLVWRIRWKSIVVNKTYAGCPPDHSCPDGQFPIPPFRDRLNVSLHVVDKVFQPAVLGGGVYSFSYNGSDSPTTSLTNGWGELSGITLPTGATVKYDYKMDGLDGPDMFENTNDIVQNHVTTKTLKYDLEYDGVIQDDGGVEIWRYAISPVGSSVTAPDGSITETEFGNTEPPLNGNVSWDSGLTLATRSPDGTRVENLWQRNLPTACTQTTTCASYSPYEHPDNPYIKTSFTSISDSNGNPTLTAIKDFTYDKNGNAIEVREYDYVPYNSVPRVNGRPTGLPANAPNHLIRITRTEFHNATPGAASNDYSDADSYHVPSSKRLLQLPKVSSVLDKDQVVRSRTETAYDHTTYDSGNSTGGNNVLTRTWDSNKGPVTVSLTDQNSIRTSATYNSYGMPLTTTDANGVVTKIEYGPIAGPNSVVSDLYPTKTITAFGTAVARTSSAEYDFYSGAQTASADVDNAVVNTTEYDAIGRPVLAKSAVNTPAESWVRTEYNDVARYTIVWGDLQSPGDGRKVSTKFFDQIGRVRLSKKLEDAATQSAFNETGGIKVQTRYLQTTGPSGGFTYQLTSNPYRSAFSWQASSEETMGWTRSKAWHTGKRNEVETFSGAAMPMPWGAGTASTGVVITEIEENATTTTDQAGRQKRALTNAVGQLIRVDEPHDNGNLGSLAAPVQPTSYAYNALGKMVHVRQGVQDRYFLYDSLGRLTRIRQPEQEVNNVLATSGNPNNNAWTAGFSYDGNGNTTSSRDAKNTLISTVFDALNRPVQRTYSDQTPAVAFTYDVAGVPFGKGKLTKVASSVSEMRYLGYDAAGRITAAEQMTDGRSYPSFYRYDLSGSLTEQTYPSGRIVKNFIEPDGDIGSVSSRTASGPYRSYASALAYTASGAIRQLQLGNGLWESAKFNGRGQVVEMGLGTAQADTGVWRIGYQYGELDAGGNVDTGRNTGNIARQTISVSGLASPFTQTYRYDSLYRITEARETNGSNQTWVQNFGYDRYGNRTSLSQDVGGQQLVIDSVNRPQVNSLTNRFQANQGYSYDAGGNLIADAQGRQFIFNGDNKQVEVRDSQNGVLGKYLYDGGGKRVKKITASEVTVFVYDAFGKLIAEMSSAPAPASPTVRYSATDPLGSPRVITDSRGQVISRRDFMPFGDEIPSDPSFRTAALKYGVTDGVRQKFTGYQRDAETDLDFAEARMYEKRHGRFTAVDPLLASGKSDDPQTFNRYVYSLNRPLVLTDPSGLQCGEQLEMDVVEEGEDFEKVPTVIVGSARENQLAVDIAQALNRGYRNERVTLRSAAINARSEGTLAAIKDVADSFDPTVTVGGGLTGPSGSVTIDVPSPARLLDAFFSSSVTTETKVALNRIETEENVNEILMSADVRYQKEGVEREEIDRSLRASADRAVELHRAAKQQSQNKPKEKR
jgi:RHS repeat-associated protein